MLEQQQEQLVNGLRELYSRAINHQGWKGAQLQNTSNGHPLTHDILERLGALKVDSHPTDQRFEDNLDVLQQTLKEEENTMTPCPTESAYSPSQVSGQDAFSPRYFPSEPLLPSSHFPPTPPTHSPNDQSSGPCPMSSVGMDTPMVDPATLQGQHQAWIQSPAGYDGEMDFLPYDIATTYDNLSMMQQKANICLPMSAWDEDDLGTLGLNGALS